MSFSSCSLTRSPPRASFSPQRSSASGALPTLSFSPSRPQTPAISYSLFLTSCPSYVSLFHGQLLGLQDISRLLFLFVARLTLPLPPIFSRTVVVRCLLTLGCYCNVLSVFFRLLANFYCVLPNGRLCAISSHTAALPASHMSNSLYTYPFHQVVSLWVCRTPYPSLVFVKWRKRVIPH